MVTIDAVGLLLWSQALMSIALFFALQILTLAGDKLERVGDWLVYRGCWFAMGLQVISMVVLALLVFNTPTDPDQVGRTVLLILANMTWFASLRGVFLFVDYKYSRSVARD